MCDIKVPGKGDAVVEEELLTRERGRNDLVAECPLDVDL